MSNDLVGTITNIVESFISTIILLGKFLVIVVCLFIVLLFNNFFSSSGSSDNNSKLKKYIRDNIGSSDDYET